MSDQIAINNNITRTSLSAALAAANNRVVEEAGIEDLHYALVRVTQAKRKILQVQEGDTVEHLMNVTLRQSSNDRS